ncbi:MAG: hypothetical protein PHD97_11230 [Bacteroidales bacterium]|nr:hypothetical protein [Bacteroidales bacterium]
MSLLDYFENHGKKFNKEHFTHLVQVARADGIITTDEKELLYNIGKRLGFTQPEIEEVVNSNVTKLFSPPYEFEERFNQLYDIISMTLADGIIDKSETRITKCFSIALGFSPDTADKTIEFIVNGINNKVSAEDLFESFRKKKF